LSQKKDKKRKNHQGTAMVVLLVGFFWGLSAIWVAAGPTYTSPWNAKARSKVTIDKLNKVLMAFKETHNDIPQDLNELRAFADSSGKSFNPYDNYGQKVEYLRLDQKHYMLRSFGADGVQNTEDRQTDIGVASWGGSPKDGLYYEYLSALDPEPFPVALLDGQLSPDRTHMARLFVDSTNMTRHLVVKKMTPNGIFMVSEHKFVEEFLWLPSGHHIIYTATGSTRHRDGIYIWNLKTDRTANLTELILQGSSLEVTGSDKRLWINLVGIHKKESTVFAFIMRRHDGPLDPDLFYSKANLFGFQITDLNPIKIKLMGRQAFETVVSVPLHKRTLDPKLHIAGTSSSLTQKLWLDLPTSGELEKVVGKWQSFSDKSVNSPVFPYTLWYLTGLYSEGYSILTSHKNADAEVIRAFGTELSGLLLKYAPAPTYLRSFGAWAYDSLMNGNPLSSHVANLTISTIPGDSSQKTPEKEAKNNH
jgi:hypothetical protein